MPKKILIYNSGGGLGDAIQLFPLILSLKNIFERSEIYYLSAHENHYSGKLKEYNIKLIIISGDFFDSNTFFIFMTKIIQFLIFIF